MMRTVGLLLLLGSTGCITQRSLALGQLASPVGKGAAELNLSTGVMYQSQIAPPTSFTDVTGASFTDQLASRGFVLPWFEVNANYGLTERLGLNVHLSPAGVQPGAKITLNRSKVANIALLPQIGVGYFSYGQVNNVAGSNGQQVEVAPTSTTLLLFTAGMKVLISHRSGFYTGFGYDLYLSRSVLNGTIGAGTTVQLTQTITSSLQHQISGAVGMSIAVNNFVSIRPEVAFAVIPGISGSQSVVMGNTIDSGGGFAWAILPGFGFALTTPPDRSDKGAEEDDKNIGEEEKPEEKSEEESPKQEREREYE